MSVFRSNKNSQSYKPEYTGIQGQTSASIIPIPIVWGMTRITGNLIWYGDFTAHKQKQKTGKGGGNQSVSYTYTASIQDGLCEGPIHGVARAWRDQSRYPSYATEPLGFTLALGTYPQAPWGYLTSQHPTEALGYPGTAHLDRANYDLGSTNTLGNLSVEVQGLRYNTAGTAGDADPALVIYDFLLDPHYSVLFPTSQLDQASLLSGPNAPTTGDAAVQTYCQALGLAFSPHLSNQEPGLSILDRWTSMLNVAVVWTGYILKLIPYGDQTITAHGVTYLPDLTIRYNLTDKDYIRQGKDADPLILTRTDLADSMNSRRIEILDRDNQYNPAIVEWKDQSLIDRYGLRPDSTFSAREVCVRSIGSIMVALMGQRKAYIRNTYKTTVSQSFSRLEPMDLITCTDPRWGTFAVRVVEISEIDGSNQLEMTFEEYPRLTSTSPGFSSQVVTNNSQNTAADPGPVNPPIIFEPRSDLSGGVAQVWAAVSGGDGTTYSKYWGGCFVWLSTDGGTTYQQIGQIDTPARQGKLTATLAAYGGANPDTTHTASVDLSMSHSDLVGVTSAEAANAVTLSYVGGELFSYQDATLTSADHYDLGTQLYRGLYGTTPASHAPGTAFARLDDNIFKFDLPKAYIGGSIELKFQSYNIWGQGLEDLSTCTVYTYVPLGTGFGSGTGGVPAIPTGLNGSGGLQANTLIWDLNSESDNVTQFKLYRGTGTSIAFGSCALVATLGGGTQTWTDTGLAPNQTYTYYLVASNLIGDSGHSAAKNLTTSAVGITIVRWQGSLEGQPMPAQELFNISCVGDEHFSAGLPLNILECRVAPTNLVQLPIYLDNAQVGYGQIAAGATTGTWSLVSALSPTAAQNVRFNSPTSVDPTLSGLSWTWNGTRS